MALSTPELVHLPGELLGLISTFLANRDIKSLRRTCRLLYLAVRLRLSRVFLSANPRNINVFRAIADHEAFCQQVSEIIWDDTRLTLARRHNGVFRGEDTAGGCPQWFSSACEVNLHVINHLRVEPADRPDDVAQEQPATERLPLRDCWAHFQELLRQEDEVLASNADVDAFQYGLERFPSLQRVTVTPTAHGLLFAPLYETPMIRAFPRGFNYSMPRSWYFRDMDLRPMPTGMPAYESIIRPQWRGLRYITPPLAQSPQHGVVELVIDVNHRLYGIKTKHFNGLDAVLRRRGFRRLDLALIIRSTDS